MARRQRHHLVGDATVALAGRAIALGLRERVLLERLVDLALAAQQIAELIVGLGGAEHELARGRLLVLELLVLLGFA